MGKFAELIAEASDAPAFFDKDSAIGESVSGTITALSLRQTRDFKTKEPETWKDGTPRQQFVAVLQTTLNQFEGDDGKRSIYIKWWGSWRKAFAKSILTVNAEEPELGGSLRATFVGLDVEGAKDDMSPAKIFEYTYAAPGTDLPTPATASTKPAK